MNNNFGKAMASQELLQFNLNSILDCNFNYFNYFDISLDRLNCSY